LPAGFDFDRWVYLTTKLTANNEILRSFYFYLEPGNPQTAIQVVLRHPVLNLTFRSYSSEEQRQQILDADWEAPFEPGKPFVRYMLLEHSKDGTRDLVIKLDHATYDGSLLYIFDDQFIALSHNEPCPQPTPFREYINYVASTPKQPQIDYWKRILGGHQFNYLSDIVEPKISTFIMGKISADVGLDALAEMSGVTPPIVFQTGFSLLLAHLSGSRDVVYTNLIAGRNIPIDNPVSIPSTTNLPQILISSSSNSSTACVQTSCPSVVDCRTQHRPCPYSAKHRKTSGTHPKMDWSHWVKFIKPSVVIEQLQRRIASSASSHLRRRAPKRIPCGGSS